MQRKGRWGNSVGKICCLLRQPDIDVFASQASHQLLEYMSWKPDPGSRGTDALYQTWTGLFPYAFPPFSQGGFWKSSKTQDQNNHYHSDLGDSVLVPSAFENVYPGTIDPPWQDLHLKEPSGRISPSNTEQLHETGCMAHLREPSGSAKVSKTASKLIENARSSGTRRNYQSAWSQLCSWCASKQFDLVHCDLEHISSFLGNLFDRKLEYGSRNFRNLMNFSLFTKMNCPEIVLYPESREI